MAKSIAERFWAKVDKDGPIPAHRPDLGPCWLWTACATRGGYGLFAGRDMRLVLAHRFAYEMLARPIPEGLQIDHLCRSTRCVNPAHLEPVTSRVNVHRALTSPAGINARKTHCKHGHQFTAENTRIDGLGKRNCRTCDREGQRRLRARKAALQ